MAFSGGAGSSSPTAGAAIPVVTTGPTTVPDRPDASPERYREARTEADKVSQQLLEETFNQQMRGQAPSLKASTIRDLRSRLIAQFQLSERQATRVINESLNNNLVPGRDAPDVQNAVAGREAPAAAQQSDADANAGGQQQQSGGMAREESRGAGLARMQRGQQAAPTPSGTPPPRTPTPPSQQVAASPTPPPPPPPVPGAPMPRADGTNGMPQPLVADGTPQPEAVAVAQDMPVPEGAPVVPNRTDGVPRNPIPDAPRRPQGMQGESRTLLGTTDRRGVLPSDEALDNFHTTAVRAQFVLRGNVPQAPIPVPVRPPNDTFVARTREPSTTKTGERREGGEDRVGGSLDRSLALGMRRQFRDTVC